MATSVDSEGQTQTTVSGVTMGQLNIGHAVADDGSFGPGHSEVVNLNSNVLGIGSPTAADFNEITGLSIPDATKLLINANLSLFVDAETAATPSLSTLVAAGNGTDVDLDYAATAGTGINPGISAPLTLIDVSGLHQALSAEGLLEGGNFHATFNETQSSTRLVYLGAQGSDLVTINGLPVSSGITGGGSDDYFGVTGGGAHFIYNSASDALVNNGAVPEGGQPTTLNPFQSQTTVPLPGAEGETGTMETVIGFQDQKIGGQNSDFLQFKGMGLTAGTGVGSLDLNQEIDQINNFFMLNGVVKSVVAVQEGADNVYVFADANHDGSFTATLDPVIHLYNGSGISATQVAAHDIQFS